MTIEQAISFFSALILRT